jgi:hypothetical protein
MEDVLSWEAFWVWNCFGPGRVLMLDMVLTAFWQRSGHFGIWIYGTNFMAKSRGYIAEISTSEIHMRSLCM